MSVVIVAVSTSYKRKERASLANAPASTVTTNGQRKPLAHTNAVYPQACHLSQSISFPFFTRVGPPGRLASLHLHPSYTCIPVLLFYQAVFCTSSNSAFTPSVERPCFTWTLTRSPSSSRVALDQRPLWLVRLTTTSDLISCF